MEYICEICGFSAKNANGLRLHSRVHRVQDYKKGEDIKVDKDTTEIVSIESDNKKIVMARIKLYDEDRLVIEYPVSGQDEIDKAKAHAEKRGYRIEIENIAKINI